MKKYLKNLLTYLPTNLLTFKHKRRKTAFTLAETLITLGIIGIVAALVMPGVITNIQKHRNLVTLKRAYRDVSNFLQMFDTEFDCGGDLLVCAPTPGGYSHTFVNKFIQYLEDKHGFKNLGNGAKNYDWHIIVDYNSTLYFSAAVYPDPVPLNQGGFLVAPNGAYALSVVPHMYDNYYNLNDRVSKQKYGAMRARIFIHTDPKRFGEKTDSSMLYNNRVPKMGKNAFELFISNKEFIIPQGSPLCKGGVYFCGGGLTEEQMAYNGPGGPGAGLYSMYKIIHDGWQINYEY